RDRCVVIPFRLGDRAANVLLVLQVLQTHAIHRIHQIRDGRPDRADPLAERVTLRQRFLRAHLSPAGEEIRDRGAVAIWGRLPFKGHDDPPASPADYPADAAANETGLMTGDSAAGALIADGIRVPGPTGARGGRVFVRADDVPPIREIFGGIPRRIEIGVLYV